MKEYKITDDSLFLLKNYLSYYIKYNKTIFNKNIKIYKDYLRYKNIYITIVKYYDDYFWYVKYLDEYYLLIKANINILFYL